MVTAYRRITLLLRTPAYPSLSNIIALGPQDLKVSLYYLPRTCKILVASELRRLKVPRWNTRTLHLNQGSSLVHFAFDVASDDPLKTIIIVVVPCLSPFSSFCLRLSRLTIDNDLHEE